MRHAKPTFGIQFSDIHIYLNPFNMNEERTRSFGSAISSSWSRQASALEVHFCQWSGTFNCQCFNRASGRLSFHRGITREERCGVGWRGGVRWKTELVGSRELVLPGGEGLIVGMRLRGNRNACSMESRSIYVLEKRVNQNQNNKKADKTTSQLCSK